jgi:hypothetical protein
MESTLSQSSQYHLSFFVSIADDLSIVTKLLSEVNDFAFVLSQGLLALLASVPVMV